VKLRLTGLGIKALLFYGVVLAVHFAASYSNLYFLLLCFATSLGLCALLGTVRNMSGADATVSPVTPVPAGTPPRVRFALRGNPVAASVEILLADGTRLEGARPRGLYRVASVRLVSTWPLGLVRAVRELEPLDPVIVYPEPLLPGEEGGVGVAGGEEGTPQAVDGMMQPSSLREYRPGDPLRRIHWRSMARRGEPVVAVWEAGCGEGYEFLIDLRAADEALERALRRIAGFAQLAREEKVPLTLHTQDLVETYGLGHKSWNDLWRYLAAVRRLPAESLAPPRVGTHVVRLTA
jgi:uncharacterized protein (DUF58 family)